MSSSLSKEDKEHFDREGYVVVRGAFDPDRWITPLLKEYEEVLDRLANELFAEGRLSQTYAHLPFSERFIEVCAETNETHHQFFDFSLPQGNVRPDTPMWNGQAVFDMLRCPKLLNLVEGFIGSEIYSNPVQHVRIRVPESREPRDPNTGALKLGTTPWHQDNGVVLPEADDTQILTVWFPLRRATVEHGCLQVVPKSHLRGLLTHCPGGPSGLQVPEKVAPRETAIALPMNPGDVLFLNKLTLHNSTPNTSNEIRISFDLRYNPIGQATGRGAFPGFVVRSEENPDSALQEQSEWERLWIEARAHLAKVEYSAPFNRWNADSPVCA